MTDKMKPIKKTVNSSESLLYAIDELKSFFKYYKHFTLECYEKRGLSQNALQHKWYSVIAKQTGFTDRYIKNYCKLHFGCPIYYKRNDPDSSLLLEFMRAQNWQMWANKWAMSIEEAKMEIVGTQQLTSKFKKHEATEYMRQIEMHYSEQGLILPTKEDEEWM